MAGMLKFTAAMSVNRGHPASFYSGEKNNPVFQALEQETRSYINYMRKRAAAGNSRISEEESCSRQ